MGKLFLKKNDFLFILIHDEEIKKWKKQWKIMLNERKSIHINFTNKKITHIPVTIDEQQIAYSSTAKYLGAHVALDAKLRWISHVKKSERS